MNKEVDKLIGMLEKILKDIRETLEKLQKLDPQSTDYLEMEQRLLGKLSNLENKYKSFKDDLNFCIS